MYNALLIFCQYMDYPRNRSSAVPVANSVDNREFTLQSYLNIGKYFETYHNIPIK